MSDIEKVSVALTREQVAALKAAVEAGEYATTSEIVREALREWQFKRRLRQEDVDRLRQLWDAGKASGAAEAFDGDLTLAAAQARLRETGTGCLGASVPFSLGEKVAGRSPAG
jgi:antitoxin ParD1/3/4